MPHGVDSSGRDRQNCSRVHFRTPLDNPPARPPQFRGPAATHGVLLRPICCFDSGLQGRCLFVWMKL